MTLKIIHKNNTSAGQAPSSGDLDIGEIAVNSADAKLYTKDNNGAVQEFISKFEQTGSGAVERTVESKLKDVVSVKDFGAVGDGVTDDTAAIQAAIDAAAVIVTNGTGDFDQVTASVYIPSGKYRTTTALQLKNCVQIYGAGSGSTWIVVDHTGNGMYSAAGSTYANILINGLRLISNGSANDGIVVEGQIRNCVYDDVVLTGFRYSFRLLNTWTTKFNNCVSTDSVRHINCETGTGGVHIYGGRYDVADDHGIYMDSGTGELIVNDAAVQFGKKSAVYVKNAYTVEINQCFFEGNCIGSASDYYVYISNDNPSIGTLTSALVTNCVMNNLADPNRDGLGVLYINNYRKFKYQERWTRNNVSSIPIIGDDVPTINLEYNSATSRSPLLSEVTAGSSSNAFIQQLARPIGVFGQDMADISFAPTTRAAFNVGQNSAGVAIGTYNSIGTLTGYGNSFRLDLNPAGGTVYIGSQNARVDSNTNEFTGRLRLPAQITSSNFTPDANTGIVFMNTSAGGRSVNLTNIAHSVGRMFKAIKTTGDSNTLIVNPGSGTINGAANWSSTDAYASVTIISDGTNWFISN